MLKFQAISLLSEDEAKTILNSLRDNPNSNIGNQNKKQFITVSKNQVIGEKVGVGNQKIQGNFISLIHTNEQQGKEQYQKFNVHQSPFKNTNLSKNKIQHNLMLGNANFVHENNRIGLKNSLIKQSSTPEKASMQRRNSFKDLQKWPNSETQTLKLKQQCSMLRYQKLAMEQTIQKLIEEGKKKDALIVNLKKQLNASPSTNRHSVFPNK